jgi:hypothetical protein
VADWVGAAAGWLGGQDLWGEELGRGMGCCGFGSLVQRCLAQRIGVDERVFPLHEGLVGNIKLFFGELAGLRLEEAEKNIAVFHFLVVFILLAGFAHDIEIGLSAMRLHLTSFAAKGLVFVEEVKLKGIVILLEF